MSSSQAAAAYLHVEHVDGQHCGRCHACHLHHSLVFWSCLQPAQAAARCQAHVVVGGAAALEQADQGVSQGQHGEGLEQEGPVHVQLAVVVRSKGGSCSIEALSSVARVWSAF